MESARTETERYHNELYANHELFEPGTWLHKPASFVMKAVANLPAETPAQVLDLGAGVGRHAIPIAQTLPEGSKVTAVDLLPIAIDKLRENARSSGVMNRIDARVADIENYRIAPNSFDLIIGCSVLEHVQSIKAFEAILHRIQQGTAPGGLNCLVIGAERKEIGPSGDTENALVEVPLTAEYVLRVLKGLYSNWVTIEQSNSVVEVAETRNGVEYTLSSRCVRIIAQRKG